MAPVETEGGQQLQADVELGLSSGVFIQAPPRVVAFLFDFHSQVVGVDHRPSSCAPFLSRLCPHLLFQNAGCS